MAVNPLFQMPDEAVKLRFSEPFVSEGQNFKDSGIIPKGIYNGYTPSAPGSNKLRITVDPARLDSVAVAETVGKHNLTVRYGNILELDFTGHVFPPDVWVVLRALYSLTPEPFSGLTDAKILTTASPLTTDIKICRVTGNAGGLITFTTGSGDRDYVGRILTLSDMPQVGVNYFVSAGSISSPVSISAAIDTLIPPLALSPAAGNYIVTFSCNWGSTGGPVQPKAGFGLYCGGVLIPATDHERATYPYFGKETAITTKVPVAAGQIVEARCRVITCSTVEVYSRSLTLLQVI